MDAPALHTTLSVLKKAIGADYKQQTKFEQAIPIARRWLQLNSLEETNHQQTEPTGAMPNLYPGTPFIGRQDELATIKERLSTPNCRLLTLVEPGGMGKTRLALEAGKQVDSALFTKLFFVPLASVAADRLGIEYAWFYKICRETQ